MMGFPRSSLTNAERIPQIDRWQRLNGRRNRTNVTVGAALVVTRHSFSAGVECKYRRDSPLSVLMRRDSGHLNLAPIPPMRHNLYYAQLESGCCGGVSPSCRIQMSPLGRSGGRYLLVAIQSECTFEYMSFIQQRQQQQLHGEKRSLCSPTRHHPDWTEYHLNPANQSSVNNHPIP
jgi:hypothetical protein